MKITKETVIYLYGYVYESQMAYKGFTQKGYTIGGYIDRSAEKYTDENIQIYSLNQLVDLEKRNAFVIIFVRSAFKHEDIARILFENGFEYILFLPTSGNVKKECENIFRTTFHMLNFGLYSGSKAPYCFENEVWEMLEKVDFPPYKNCYMDMFDVNRSVVEKRGRYLTVWCPWNIAYNSSKLFEEMELVKKPTRKMWKNYDIPHSGDRLYRGLLDFFENQGEGREVREYMKERIFSSSTWEVINFKDELNWRIKMLISMEAEFCKGFDYFICDPAIATWNDRGVFNMNDGKHRAAFLTSRGMKYIPIQITWEEFDKWCNNSVLEKCIKYIKKEKIRQLKTIIPHPAFYLFPSEHEWGRITLLGIIQKWFYEKNIAMCHILEISSYNSYFSRNLYRMGAAKMVTLETNDTWNHLACLWNELLYVKNCKVVNNFLDIEQYGPYQIAFLMDMDMEIVQSESLKNIINKSISGIIFWQSSGECIEAEKMFILNNTNFKYYKKILECYNGKFISEFGVFSNWENFHYESR